MPEAEKDKLGVFPFVVSGLSFIPLLGVPLGIVLIIWGLATRKSGGKWLALIGFGGIAFSVILYGSLFYMGFVQKGGPFDKLRAMQVKQNFPMAIQAIEYYKMQHGKYPADLDELVKSRPAGSSMMDIYLLDPSYNPLSGSKTPTVTRLYYQLVDENHYYLLSVGADGKPFTDDDVVPDQLPGEKNGLLIKKDSTPVPEKAK